MDIDTNEVISSALAGVLGTFAFAGFFLAIGNTGSLRAQSQRFMALGLQSL
jgi:hypothetical protein